MREECGGWGVVGASHEPEHDKHAQQLPVRAGGGERQAEQSVSTSPMTMTSREPTRSARMPIGAFERPRLTL